MRATAASFFFWAEKHMTEANTTAGNGAGASQSAGISRREFLDATEDPELADLVQAGREDRERRLGISTWRSFRIPSGLAIEPVLSLSWFEIDSTEPRYDTQGLEFGLSLSAGF